MALQVGIGDPKILPVKASDPQDFFRNIHSNILLIFYSDLLISNPLLQAAILDKYDNRSLLKYRKAGLTVYDKGD